MPHAQPQNQSAPSLSWTARLQRLETALSESPDSAQAWHWRVQIKVLRFLVSRYGNVNLAAPTNNKNASSPIPDFPLPDPPCPPKSLAAMQRVLTKVEKINELKPNDPLPSHTLPDGRPAPIIPPFVIKYFKIALLIYIVCLGIFSILNGR